MRSFFLPALLIVLSLTGVANAQTSGGPDNFGYHWANNLDPIGSAPVYNWKSIKDTANLVKGLKDDNSSKQIDLGFYFNYYGQWYNTFFVGSNGWVSFQNAGNMAAPFPQIPSASSPDNIIAALLSDLTFIDANNDSIPGAAAYFWTNHTDSIIVEYDSVPFWDTTSAGYSGRNTFEIIMTGPDYSIQFQYKKVDSTSSYDLNATGLKIGIEDSTGADGLQVVSDSFPPDSSAIKFYYPGHYSTNDLPNSGISLGQNFPNPAGDLTTFNYSILKNGEAKISVQTLLGTQVDAFTLGHVAAGIHSFTINTRHYSPGIYLYSLSVEGTVSTRKMVVVK